MASHDMTINPAPENPWLAARAAFEMAFRDCAECGMSDEEIHLYGTAQCHAGCTLYLTPAPDADALAFKLTVFRDEQAYMLDGAYEFFDAIIADVNRLGAGGEL